MTTVSGHMEPDGAVHLKENLMRSTGGFHYAVHDVTQVAKAIQISVPDTAILVG